MSTAQSATNGTTRGTRTQNNNGAVAAKTPRGPSPDRKRFSFGPVWNAAVIAGKVTDHDKLIAQAVKLKIAAKSDAKRLKFATLLQKVQAKLQDMPENERPDDDAPHTKQGKAKVAEEGAKGKAKAKTEDKEEVKAKSEDEAKPAEAAEGKEEAAPAADQADAAKAAE